MASIDATPRQVDLRLYAGDDFSLVLRFPVDVTDRTFVATVGAPSPVAFTVTRPADEEVRFSLTGAQVTALLNTRQAGWDLQQTVGGFTRTLLAGNVRVDAQVTPVSNIDITITEGDTVVAVLEVDDQVIEVVEQSGPLVIDIIETGPPGPAGAPGGATGAYTHTQTTPGTVWTVQHQLGFKARPTVLDGVGRVVHGWAPTWPSDNVLILTFPYPLSGTAYVS